MRNTKQSNETTKKGRGSIASLMLQINSAGTESLRIITMIGERFNRVTSPDILGFVFSALSKTVSEINRPVTCIAFR